MENIKKYFGEQFASVSERKKSYDLLRTFLRDNHDWLGSISPDSDALSEALRAIIAPLSTKEFAFLLCHTGFIPEEYGHDSSEETIYTKMVEVLVGEWARRIGFTMTTLPKQKSSYEDVTVMDDKHVIVCDAKSYRLGRSQKAPNVKDVLKEGDISKWLRKYDQTEIHQLGGFVTFPSQHDWSEGSDFYLYLTNKTLPIVCLFYEHMAFMLLADIGKSELIDLYVNYDKIFPAQLRKSEGNRLLYWTAINSKLFADKPEFWENYQAVAKQVIGEKVLATIKSVELHLREIRNRVEADLPADLSVNDLRKMLVDARAERESFVVKRQLDRINAFRDRLDEFLSED